MISKETFYEAINCIDSIQKKFKFNEDFDLVKYLFEDLILEKGLSPSRMVAFEKALQEFYPRPSAKKKYLKKAISSADKFFNILKGIPESIKTELQVLLESENNDANDVLLYQSHIERLINSLQIILEKVPVDTGAKNYAVSKIDYSVNKLIHFYHIGTGVMPYCSHCREQDIYHGEFYDFLVEVRKILSIFNIKLGSDAVMGRKANALIKKYKEFLHEHELESIIL